MSDAIPRVTFGHHLICLTSWFHSGLSITIDHIVDMLGYHLETEPTAGGLIDTWQRLSEILLESYEQIRRQARASATAHVDETGWRAGDMTRGANRDADVPADNSFGERRIRPAVIQRKNGQSKRSDRGAATEAMLTSIYRTLRPAAAVGSRASPVRTSPARGS